MNVVAWILGAVLAAVFVFAGTTKVLDLDRHRERFGYSANTYRVIGLSEVAAAVGVIVGLIWRNVEWLAVGAGIGICSLMIGALITHARVEDEAKETIPAFVMFALSAAFMIVISLR